MQKVIQGQVTAIEPRNNDWFAVHILSPGKQYPVKLSTKRQDIVQDAQSLAWQMVDALYNEEQSTNINPNNGQPYVNRYLEQLAPAGTMPQPHAPQQQQQPVAVPTTGLAPQQQPQQFGNLQPQQLMPQGTHAGGFPPDPAAAQAAIEAQRQASRVGQGPQYQGLPLPSQSNGETDREDRIMRQAATKVAAAFLPSLAEEDQNLGSLIRISEQLLRYYKEGVSWETTPQSIAAPPAEYDGPPPPGDEDIPF